MSDQRLRLLAELKDMASPKLKQLAKEIKEIKTTPGMESASKWFQGFNETSNEFVKGSGGISSAMGAIGVGGISAALSISGLVREFKALADNTFAMKRLGQETGLTLDAVNQWEIVGQKFHIGSDVMAGSLKTLGDNMRDFNRHRGELFGALNQFDSKFAHELDVAAPEKRMAMILNWMSQIHNAADRNRWAEKFWGTDALDSLLTNGYPALQRAIDDTAKNTAKLTPEFQKQADLLSSSVVDFNTAWTNFEVNVGPTVFKELTQASKDFQTVFDNIKGVYDWFQANKDKSTKDFVDDNAKALVDTLKEKAEANAKARSEGKGPLFDLPGAIVRGTGSAVRGGDGNALRRNDEMPVGKSSSGGFFGGRFQRSAFTDFGSGSDGIESGVKAGVLAAFREMMTGAAGTSEPGGVPSGFQNASYTTYGGGGGGVPGFARRGRGAATGGRDNTPDGMTPLAHGKLSGSMLSRGTDAMAYLQSLGVTKEAAAAMVGNAQQESSISGHGPAGDHGTAQDMFQWRFDRFDALKRFAAARGKPWQDEHTELAFAVEEAKRRGHAEWLYGHDIYAANKGMKRFEQYGESPDGGNFRTRLGNANAWAARPMPDLNAEARRAAAAADAAHGQDAGSIEAHIHVTHEGVKGVSAKSKGVVAPPTVHLKRGPTMTQPDITA